jgi:hypothetical protein
MNTLAPTMAEMLMVAADDVLHPNTGRPCSSQCRQRWLTLASRNHGALRPRHRLFRSRLERRPVFIASHAAAVANSAAWAS